MKKWICMTMAVLMLLLAGCGNGASNNADSTNQPVPIGTWQTDLDICDLINDEVAKLEEIDVFFLVDAFVLDLEFTFRNDGTYSVTVDEESVQTAVDNLETMAEEYLLLGLEEQLMGLQNDMISDDPEVTYPEITIEQMLEQNGTSLETLKTQLRELLGLETMKDQILEQTNREGTFEAEEGVLYLSQDMQTEIDKSIFMVYTVETDVLTIEESYGGEDDLAAVYLFPIKFQKAG